MATRSAQDSPCAERRRRGRPRKGEAPPSRERLLEVGLREFAKHGYEGANLSRLASAAGFNLTLIHYHFQNKLGLWKAVVGRGFEEFWGYFRDFEFDLEGLDPVDTLRLSTRRYIRFMLAHPELARLLLLEMTQVTDRTQWLLEEHFLPNYAMFAKLVTPAQEAGLIRPMDPTEAVDFMNGATVFVVLTTRLTNELLTAAERRVNLDDPKVTEPLADHLLDLVLYGLRGDAQRSVS